jgi:hypothetical protein
LKREEKGDKGAGMFVLFGSFWLQKKSLFIPKRPSVSMHKVYLISF